MTTDPQEMAILCMAETPVMYGENRKNACVCGEPAGHDGAHVCRSAPAHSWPNRGADRG